MNYWVWITLLLTIASFISTIFVFIRQKQWRTFSKVETIENRVQILTTSLQQAIELISEIEGEIRARSVLVEQLQKDMELYDKLVELKRPEVEAIAQLLRGELRMESKSTFWKGFAVNFILFLLGALASWLITTLTK